jgi:hypothetical protein
LEGCADLVVVCEFVSPNEESVCLLGWVDELRSKVRNRKDSLDESLHRIEGINVLLLHL